MAKRRSPKTISHACNRCGNCCRRRGDIFLTPFDVLRISNHMKISCEEFIKQYCTRMNFIEVCLKTSGPEDECIFLTLVSHCSACAIYDVRPMACYLFPLGSPEFNTFELHISPYCSTSEKAIPISEFVNNNSNSRYTQDFTNLQLFLKKLNHLEQHAQYGESDSLFAFLFYNNSTEKDILKKLHSL